MVRMRPGIAERGQPADRERVAVAVPEEPDEGREAQDQDENAGDQAGAQCDLPVGKAGNVGDATGHACDARARGLPEALNK